ncbi:MAG: hypothetical protein ABW021_09670 [Acidimicrobiia bacterium]
MRIAAVVAAALLGVIAAFQLALALGMPARGMAWGGQYEGTLPVGLRITSGVAGVVIYPLATLLILEAAGMTDFEIIPDVGPVGMWVFTGLFALGGLLNLVSRSKAERVWAPVSMLIAVCCGIVAAGL